MTYRERIKYTRLLYGLTQKDVGQALGVSKQYISQCECNNVECADERLIEIINIVYKLGEAKKQGRLEEIKEDLIKVNKSK